MTGRIIPTARTGTTMTKTPADLSGWDVHTHLVPDGLIDAARKARFDMAVGNGKLQVCGHGVPLTPISDAGKLIERIQTDRLDGAVVSIPPPLFRPDLATGHARDYSVFVNDALRTVCAPQSAKLRPLAYLPIENPSLCLELAKDLNDAWVGVVIGTELGGLLYSSNLYEPVWQLLAERQLAVFLHPGSSPDERLKQFYLSNLLGNPHETTIAAAHLIFSGVLQRHPDLNFILAHGGGTIGALTGRWQQGSDTDRPGIEPLSLSPRDAVKRFYVDSLVHAPGYLDHLIGLLGAERILLGSDWPFPMGAASADHDIGHLSDELKHAIRKTNAEKAFHNRL